MSSIPLNGPVYRLEIDYPDARLVAPDLPAPIEAADLAGPTLARDLRVIADRLRRDGAACVLALPEAEVWRGQLPDGASPPSDRARRAAAAAFSCAPEDLEVALGPEAPDGSRAAAAIRRRTVAESLDYLRRIDVRPLGITGSGDFPGFAEEPLFARPDAARRPARSAAAVPVRTGLAARLPRPSLARARAAVAALPAPRSLAWPKALTPARLTTTLRGLTPPTPASLAALRARPFALAAGVVAGVVLVAGFALLRPAEQAPIEEARSERAVEVAAAPAEPRAPDRGVIFPVDDPTAARITPLAVSRTPSPETAAATADPRPRAAAAPAPTPVTVATRSGSAMPRPAATAADLAPTVASAPAASADAAATSAVAPGDPRLMVLSSRPMPRAPAAPAAEPDGEPDLVTEPQAEPALEPEAAAQAPAAGGPRPKPRAALALPASPSAAAEPAVTAPAAASPSESVAESGAMAELTRAAPPKPRRIAKAPPVAAVARPSTQAAVALAVATAAAAPRPAVAAPAPQRVAAAPAPQAVAAPVPVRAAPAAKPPAQARTVAARQKVGVSRNDISLIGVFGSSDGRHALLRLPNGKVTKVQRGDRVQGVQVAAIDRSSVLLQGGQRDTVLKMPD